MLEEEIATLSILLQAEVNCQIAPLCGWSSDDDDEDFASNVANFFPIFKRGFRKG